MWQFFSADALSLPSVPVRHFSPGSQPNERSVPFTESCGPHSGKLLETYLINRFVAVFSARQRSHDDAPTARSMPARGNAPGTCPSPCSARQERRIPAPLQGAPIDPETQAVALSWSAAALSAPESKLRKSEFTSFDGWQFMRCLLIMRPVVLVISVACVSDSETAICQGRYLDGI